ncbi:hypothetical protein NC652_015107 [Populus alba x Populus x berolinensis]|nr:hypothetical protein NC652_015107 [Populus alba x Populus x berolinensis]
MDDSALNSKTQNEQQLVCFLARFQVCMAVIIAIFTSTRQRLNSEHHLCHNLKVVPLGHHKKGQREQAMHQAGTQFWQKTRSIPRSLALLTLAMASNSSIRQSEELKWI